jgi:hypothetical protein
MRLVVASAARLLRDKPVVNEATERRKYLRLQLPSIKLVSLEGVRATNVYRCKDLGLGGTGSSPKWLASRTSISCPPTPSRSA